jgi:hypothetical protein
MNTNIKRKLALFVLSFFAFAALATAQSVLQIDHSKVDAAFAKGMSLFETNSFKVHASRRETPGIAEIHTRDTDIVYVLEGAAMLVTGGRAIGATK